MVAKTGRARSPRFKGRGQGPHGRGGEPRSTGGEPFGRNPAGSPGPVSSASDFGQNPAGFPGPVPAGILGDLSRALATLQSVHDAAERTTGGSSTIPSRSLTGDATSPPAPRLTKVGDVQFAEVHKATAYAPEARARAMASNTLLGPSSWPRQSWFLHSTKPRALTTPGYTVDYRRSWSPCVLSSAGAVFLAAFSCP